MHERQKYLLDSFTYGDGDRKKESTFARMHADYLPRSLPTRFIRCALIFICSKLASVHFALDSSTNIMAER